MSKELLSFLPLGHLSEVLWVGYHRFVLKRGSSHKRALDKINLDPNLVDEVFMAMCSGWCRTTLPSAAIYAGLPDGVAW
jgi:hypothetical protein